MEVGTSVVDVGCIVVLPAMLLDAADSVFVVDSFVVDVGRVVVIRVVVAQVVVVTSEQALAETILHSGFVERAYRR